MRAIAMPPLHYCRHPMAGGWCVAPRVGSARQIACHPPARELCCANGLPPLPCRWIAGSGVDPLLPNCPNRTWASKRLTDLVGAVKGPCAAAAGQGRAQPAAGLGPGLGSLGVVFAAVLAGAWLWRRNLLRQGRQHTVEQTLGAAEEGGLGGHSSGVPAAGGVPGGLASFAARSKKERLAALLGAALRDRSRGIEMLPLRGALRALAHQLTSQRTMSAASRQLGHPADSQPLLPVGGPGSSSGTSAGSTGEWGWRLKTNSLCLAPGQLQVRAGADVCIPAQPARPCLHYKLVWLRASRRHCGLCCHMLWGCAAAALAAAPATCQGRFGALESGWPACPTAAAASHALAMAAVCDWC